MKTIKEEMLEAIEAASKEYFILQHIYRKSATSCASIAERHINEERVKLKSLLEGLETQHVEKLLKEGKSGDFRLYGEAYSVAYKKHIKIARLEGYIFGMKVGMKEAILPSDISKLEQELEQLKKQ